MAETTPQEDLKLLLTTCMTASNIKVFDASKGYTDKKIGELKTLIDAKDVDLSSISAVIEAIMTATDGDPTKAGFQILDKLRTDVNAALLRGETNLNAITNLTKTVTDGLSNLQSQLNTAKAEMAEDTKAIRERLTSSEEKLDGEILRSTGEDAKHASAIDTLTKKLVALQEKDAEIDLCCTAVNSRLSEIDNKLIELGSAQTQTADALSKEAIARVESDATLSKRLDSVEARKDDNGIVDVTAAFSAACSAADTAFSEHVNGAMTGTGAAQSA